MKERDAPSEPQLAPIICGESYERRILMTDGERGLARPMSFGRTSKMEFENLFSIKQR